ncbi:unnamed protein product [Aphanomyces euteiches]
MKTKELTRYILSIMQQFKRFNMQKTFEHCGYTIQGRFDPTKRLADETCPREDDESHLGFEECHPSAGNE